ncbi:serine/threonine-protein kinase [candidate division CSSED10-310 bacterium]|uniref:Serine/threonine-protein kinase n=1 Tax=candidate division CSSED10-310 bacterium TaxID=2855610 RepID=A0ABV6YS60_UNCC1
MDNIKQYKIMDIIGQGGIGVVYKARDTVIGRNVAIKMMTTAHLTDEKLKKRFYQEAQTLGSLTHPHIVTLFDAGEYEHNPYLVFEYLEGRDFKYLLANDCLPATEQVLSFMIDICQALHYCHERGIVHRDIKPANIFNLKAGGVKLLDFGIAHLRDNFLTVTGDFLGTLYYTSPEQYQGKSIDHRTDIFSFGIVLYEFLTGKRPFGGESKQEISKNIVQAEPAFFKPLNNNLPDFTFAILENALAKKPDDRYQTTLEIAQDLDRVLQIVKYKKSRIKQNITSPADSEIDPDRKVKPNFFTNLPAQDPQKTVGAFPETIKDGESTPRNQDPGADLTDREKTTPPTLLQMTIPVEKPGDSSGKETFSSPQQDLKSNDRTAIDTNNDTDQDTAPSKPSPPRDNLEATVDVRRNKFARMMKKFLIRLLSRRK